MLVNRENDGDAGARPTGSDFQNSARNPFLPAHLKDLCGLRIRRLRAWGHGV